MILFIIDSGTLWVANVGDSRGILLELPVINCQDKEFQTPVLTPLSFDHKPHLVTEIQKPLKFNLLVTNNLYFRERNKRELKTQVDLFRTMECGDCKEF